MKMVCVDEMFALKQIKEKYREEEEFVWFGKGV